MLAPFFRIKDLDDKKYQLALFTYTHLYIYGLGCFSSLRRAVVRVYHQNVGLWRWFYAQNQPCTRLCSTCFLPIAKETMHHLVLLPKGPWNGHRFSLNVVHRSRSTRTRLLPSPGIAEPSRLLWLRGGEFIEAVFLRVISSEVVTT